MHEEEPLPTELRKGNRTLKLSNLDKVFFPVERITKGDLLAYYRAVAPVLVPHLKDRPFTMIRYPDGIEGKRFFQKDAPSHMPDWIPTFQHARLDARVAAQAEVGRLPGRQRRARAALDGEHGLHRHERVVLARRQARPPRLRPLRPRPVARRRDSARSSQVALLVKEALDAFGLVGFPKTSSADGMHVLVPVERRYTFEDTRRFSEIVAGAIARSHRGLATTEWTKSKRRGVLIDSNQNGEGKTIASVYSVRPRRGRRSRRRCAGRK